MPIERDFGCLVYVLDDVGVSLWLQDAWRFEGRLRVPAMHQVVSDDVGGYLIGAGVSAEFRYGELVAQVAHFRRRGTHEGGYSVQVGDLRGVVINRYAYVPGTDRLAVFKHKGLVVEPATALL